MQAVLHDLRSVSYFWAGPLLSIGTQGARRKDVVGVSGGL